MSENRRALARSRNAMPKLEVTPPGKTPAQGRKHDILAETDGVSGREICNAVILAASSAARSGRKFVTGDNLLRSLDDKNN